MYIGLGQIDRSVRIVGDVDFPGRNIVEAAPELQSKYKKIALVVNSGSGETPSSKQVARELAEYIRKTGTKQFTINVVTSDPKSSIGLIAQEFGAMVELKGREESENNLPEKGGGIMNDVFELASMLFFQKTKECINEGKGFNEVSPKLKKETKVIKLLIEQFSQSDTCQNILRAMETRAIVVIGGKGPAEHVATMTAIRLQHVKRALYSDACLTGPFAPRPQAGDVLILISWS